jgi:hypothetical protein
VRDILVFELANANNRRWDDLYCVR